MSRKTEATFAKCPYYHSEKHAKIVCREDDREDSPWVNINFLCIADRSSYESRYCKGRWEECPLAKALNEKFGYKV